ncbi:MAG: AraC family transcriptional regulator [Clostridia bacterium]|nr:AraC family transcriptional regulator [Clostridia bacterium]
MDKKPVNEKKPFNTEGKISSVYIDCIHRKILKESPPPIYHYHSEIELLYCVEGELAVNLFSNQIILGRGDFMYIAPNTPHSTSANTDFNEHICVKFVSSVLHVPSSHKIPPVDYFVSQTENYTILHSSKENYDYIRNLFFACVKNFSHDNYYKRLALRASIMQIMTYVFSESVCSATEESPKAVSDVFLSVLDYIDRNYATVTLEDAANYCSLSYSYFSRIFKSLFNISFSNYVIKKRVEKSLALISNSNHSLNDIALECGFANLSHFIKCFSEEKGMTPKKFRAMVQAKNM